MVNQSSTQKPTILMVHQQVAAVTENMSVALLLKIFFKNLSTCKSLREMAIVCMLSRYTTPLLNKLQATECNINGSSWYLLCSFVVKRGATMILPERILCMWIRHIPHSVLFCV